MQQDFQGSWILTTKEEQVDSAAWAKEVLKSAAIPTGDNRQSHMD
jgi:hypothetical protein